MRQQLLFEGPELMDIFSRVSENIEERVAGYLIGGLSMIFHKAKNVTKDVDIVFGSTTEAEIFESGLARIGFSRVGRLPEEYKAMNAHRVMENPDSYHFDIFVRIVCKCLSYTESIKARAKEVFSSKNITLHASSLEDIFLFKGITDRPADKIDMVSIARSGLDWTIIENELMAQPDHWQYLPTYYRNLEILRDEHDIISPSLRRLKDDAELCMAIALIVQRFEGGEFTQEQAAAALEDAKGGFTDQVLGRMMEMDILQRRGGKFVIRDPPADIGDTVQKALG